MDKFKDYILMLVGFIAISYSTYQTSRGYEQAAGNYWLSLGFSIIISISLALLLLSLRSKVNKNESGILGVIFIYCVFAFFSIIANFNTFFSGFIKQTIVTQEIDYIYTQLSEIQTDGLKSISKADNVDELRTFVEAQTYNLRKQILDRRNPGYGVRAKEIVKELEKGLKITFTEAYGEPLDILNSFESQIEKALDLRIKKSLSERELLSKEIIYTITDTKKIIDSVKLTTSIEDDFLLLGNLSRTVNDIGRKINGFIKNETIYKIKIINSDVTGIGEIPFALRKAIQDDFWFQALIALLISLALDFLVPLLIFVITPRKKIRKKRLSVTYMPERLAKDNPDTEKSLKDILSQRKNYNE